jgi:predicted enzyme related to lactoylglutathione lyase
MPEVQILFAGVPVADLEAAAVWYGRLFGRPADIVVTATEVMWRFADAAWLYIVEDPEDPERVGRALTTLCVADLQQTLAEMEERGIRSGPVKIVGDSGRKAVIVDPDGNILSFIEVLDSPR